jgi:hypothetical protein
MYPNALPILGERSICPPYRLSAAVLFAAVFLIAFVVNYETLGRKLWDWSRRMCQRLESKSS